MNKIDIIKNIYRNCFGVDEEFENSLFENCQKDLKCLEKNGTVVSFLFALPCKVKQNNSEISAVYVFAAATDQNHRNKGYMAELLELTKKEFNHIVLRPANENLIGFYKKFGFLEFIGNDKNPTDDTIEPIDSFKILTELTDKTKEGEFVLMGYGLPEDFDNVYFPYTMP